MSCSKRKAPNRWPWRVTVVDKPASVTEFAPAKVNLTLHVTGQREDGFHLLDSLVAFADVGDHVRLTPAQRTSLEVSGPMAAGVPTDESNLCWRAAECFGAPVAIELEKHLPHAAGIGGGSSDAAAVLRGMARLFGRPAAGDMLELGADVPVCMSRQTARMSGIGEIVRPIHPIPVLHAVLVNPGVAANTSDVFRELAASSADGMPAIPETTGTKEFCAWLREQRNDLEAAAISLQPDIGSVLETLRETGALCVRMSGSGATCFGLYADQGDAALAAQTLARAHSNWWVRQVEIR